MPRLTLALLAAAAVFGGAAGPATALDLTVDRLDDDALPAGACSSGVAGDCTLRRAVALVNGANGPHVIRLPAGNLARDASLPAPILSRSTTIIGQGARATVLHGSKADPTPSRVLGARFQPDAPGAVELRDLTLTGGRGTEQLGGGPGAMGGGLGAEYADVTLRRVAVVGNHADGGGDSGRGGGVRVVFGDLVLRSVTVAGNAATGVGGSGGNSAGGGVDVALGALDAENVTVSGNRAETTNYAARGGGIHVGTGSALLRHVTVAQNAVDGKDAQDIGGNVALSGATALWSGSVVAGGMPANCDAVGTSAGGNVADAAGCFAGATDRVGAPALGPLQGNGGPTDTRALLAGSAALDAAGACGLAADQRGVSRPQGPACDAGALEVAVPQAPPAPGGDAAAAPPTLGASRSTATAAVPPECSLTPRGSGSGLRLDISCDRAVEVAVSGVATIAPTRRARGAQRRQRSRRIALPTVRRLVPAGRTAALTMPIPGSIATLVRRGRRVSVALTASVGGRQVGRASIKRLRPPPKKRAGEGARGRGRSET